MSYFVASAPGKIILTGEHAVVYKKHAVATVITKRTFAEFSMESAATTSAVDEAVVTFEVVHPQLRSKTTWTLAELQLIPIDKEVFADPCQVPTSASVDAVNASIESHAAAFGLTGINDKSARVFLLYFLALFGARQAVHVRMTSELPIGAGLGSSASLCVVLSAGFQHLLLANKEVTVLYY